MYMSAPSLSGQPLCLFICIFLTGFCFVLLPNRKRWPEGMAKCAMNAHLSDTFVRKSVSENNLVKILILGEFLTESMQHAAKKDLLEAIKRAHLIKCIPTIKI